MARDPQARHHEAPRVQQTLPPSYLYRATTARSNLLGACVLIDRDAACTFGALIESARAKRAGIPKVRHDRSSQPRTLDSAASGEFLYFLKWRASRAAGRAAACGSPEPPGLAPSRLGDRGTAGQYRG
jgi:hypothetical protein